MKTDWAEYRTTEFRKIDPMRTIAVLPTAAIEQHGPHLPVGTDTMIASGMLGEVKRILPKDLDIRILPVQAVGKSNEHVWAVGTVTLTAETALRAWTEIGESVSRAGVGKIVIVNSHGGNLDLVSIVARELRVRFGMLAVKCQWGSFGLPDDLHDSKEQKFGIHGGNVETSLMLHFRPDLVAMEHAEDFASTAEHDRISPTGPISYGWIASDLNPAGTVGNAGRATGNQGRLIASFQASGFVELLRKVAEMKLDRFRPATRPD